MSHSHLNPGLISAYNSLTDKHLAGYFSSSRIRRHLQRAGLITRSGRIVPDKEYRQKLIQKAHQRHVRECLAQAIFHKVLEMERIHQIEIKRKLEEFARRERVHKIKVERSKRYEEDIIRILSPRPPTGARGIKKQHSGLEGEHTESSESPGSSRPNTAPGKMQRPVRLKPLHSNSTAASHRHSSPYRRHAPPHENQRPFNGTLDKDSHRHLNSMEVRNGVSPYCLPVINNFVTPVPPSTKRKERPVKLSTSSTHRGRRLRPTTASSGADVSEDPPVLRSSVPQSKVCVNMMYLGKTVHVSHDLPDMRDEVRVFQQHCGGENLCVYKGKLREGESFQFISRRHRGFPFSLTFFLNGLQVERLSSCCEFKHRKSSRLGGRHGHFAFSGIEAASPCYKCIIAMGLDKKPVPPPKRAKGDAFKVGIVPRLTVTAGADTEASKDNPASRSECESSPTKDTEITAKEDKAPEDSKAKDDYEEDFEADDEGPVEEEKEKKCTSPNEEKEEKGKETDASDSEDDDRKSGSGSSLSGSESDAEEVKEAKEEEEQDRPEDAEEVQEETQHVDAEAARATESESTEAKDCEIQDSAGQSTEIEISDTSVPSGNEKKEASDTRTAAEGEKRTEDEPERAKSVQEKLAEAILKESHCSSEPELSDTSTETTEVGSNKSTEKEIKVVEPVTETCTGQPEVIEEEKKIEETLVQEEVKPEDETNQPEEITEVDSEQNDNVNDKTASESGKDEDTGEKGASVEIVEEVKRSPLQDEPNEEAEKERNGEESEQEARSIQKEDESSGADTKPDETAKAVDTETLTVTETMEMKAEALDIQEAINAEVATVTDTRAHDQQQDAVENTAQESEVSAKDDKMTEHVQVTDENEGDKVEKQSDLNEFDKDKTQVQSDAGNMGESKIENICGDVAAEEAGTNLNIVGQDKDEGVKSETDNLENQKRESDLKKEENKAEYEDVMTDINTEDQKGEDNKASNEEDGSDKPKEELENTETGDIQNGDTSEEKCVGENVKNEEEVQQTESEIRNDADKNLDESSRQKEEEEEETIEDSVKLTEENTPNEENASDKPQEELENTETSDNINGDTSKEKDVGEEVKNTAQNEDDVQQTASDARNDADKNLDESGNHESSIQKEEEEQETIVDSVNLTEENVKSDEGAGAAEEAPNELLNNDPASDKLEKENKSIDNDVDASEVDAENGEVSVVAETRQTNEGATKNTAEECDGVTQVDQSEKQEKELKQENENNGNDLNDTASIPSNQEEIKSPNKELDTTENNNSLEIAQSTPDKPTVGQVAAVDVFAADVENGDTEEASKASEEGASVLLKPHDNSSLNEQNDQNEQKGSPEGLTTADSADLVNNWVTMHQTSKYFETFVEPLEEIRDMNSETSNMPSKDLPQSESPVQMVSDGEKGNGTEKETKDETSDRGSDQSEAKQNVSTKDVAQVEETKAVHVPSVENMKESIIEESLKDKTDQSTSEVEKTDDSFAQLNNNHTRTSITSSHRSITSGKHDIVSESLNEEKVSNNGKDATITQKAKTKELPENSDSLQAIEPTTSEEAQENSESKEVKGPTDCTPLKSDSGSEQEVNKIQTSSVSAEKREVMEESNHTVSKEYLSTFSVDDAVFGNSSFPLVTAAKVENGH